MSAYSIKHITFFTVVISLLQFMAFGQEATITTNPYTQQIRIGEPIQVDISIHHPEAKTFQYPSFPADTITQNIELTEPVLIDTLFANSEDKSSILGFTYTLHLTSFDSGLWAMPQIPFIINEDTVLSDAFLIEVTTVAVDTSKAFAPIVEPMELPYTWKEIGQLILTYGGWAYASLFVIALLVYFLGSDPAKQQHKTVAPKIPPHQIALSRLQELEEEQLLEKGAIKAFHIQLSDIVRQYIENRYNVLARESTTDEIKHMLKQLRLDTTLRTSVISSLRISDLVKFAKAHPQENENALCLQTAFELINSTIPAPQDTQTNSDNE